MPENKPSIPLSSSVPSLCPSKKTLVVETFLFLVLSLASGTFGDTWVMFLQICQQLEIYLSLYC